ncbi:unnamed protein product [Sympodiomycopsis kandeliae]
MALIVDPEWMIQQLRLTYLRKVDDHFGPRIISFPSSDGTNAPQSIERAQGLAPAPPTKHTSDISAGLRGPVGSIYSQNQSSDSHVSMSGLDDPLRHPELSIAYSPTLSTPAHFASPRRAPQALGAFTLSPPPQQASRLRSDGDLRSSSAAAELHPRADGKPSLSTQHHQHSLLRDRALPSSSSLGPSNNNKGLRYTQTIFGPGRTGALGMRVSGKRTPASNPRSVAREQESDSATHLGPPSRRRRGSSSRNEPASTYQGRSLFPSPASLLRRSSSGTGTTTSDPLVPPPTLAGRHSLDTPPVPRVSIRGPTAEDWPEPPLAEAQSFRGSQSWKPSSPSLLAQARETTSLEASSEAETENTADTGEFSPAMLPGPLPSQSELFAAPASSSSVGQHASSQSLQPTLHMAPGPARRRSASASATDTLSGAGRSKLRQMDNYHSTIDVADDALSSTTSGSTSAQLKETLEDSESEAIDTAQPSWHPPAQRVLQHLRSDSSLSSLASHPADEGQTPLLTRTFSNRQVPLNATAEPVSPTRRLRYSMDGTPKLDDYQFESSIRNASQEGLAASPFSGGEDTFPKALSTSQQEFAVTVGGSASPLAPIDSIQGDIVTDSSKLVPGGTPDEAHLDRPKPSTEALIAARSKLRRPSRSQAREQTLEERQKQRQKQQNAWFQSQAIGNAQVAQRHAQPKKSALSALLQKQSVEPENPFAHFYAGIAGRNAQGRSGSMRIDMYFPWATATSGTTSASSPNGAVSVEARSKCLRLDVRKDATMEELIGYGLYCYVEEGWSPAPEDGGDPDQRLSTTGWILRIVEDGEIDDDYPAIDRSLIVGKFGQDEFAIVVASAQQAKQNEATQGSVNRRVSRLTAPLAQPRPQHLNSAAVASSPSSLAPPPAVPGAAAAAAGVTGGRLGAPRGGPTGGGPNNITATQAPAGSLISVAGTPIIASSVLSKSTAAANSGIFLRVAVTPNAQVRYKTTLNVPSETYLADVLDLICKKRSLANPDEWAFVVPDKNIVVPLDRTVESLQGSHDLALVKRSTLGAQGDQAALASQSTNPNASIFKRLSEPAQPRYNAAKDVTSTYKSWTVNRKMPMFVGRHERTLTIDGDWIHIIPTDTRAFYAHAASFPILDVVSCKQSLKMPQNFKLIFSRENDQKRYDLEAEDSKQAADIAFEITMRKRASKK